VDAFFTQYLVMIGDFEIVENPPTEGVQSTVSVILLYTYFIIATFFANILFFNVLVAVIGEAYSERYQKREFYQ
jgi:predicted cobalt transporter CbtA